jgi:hypothetical protein
VISLIFAKSFILAQVFWAGYASQLCSMKGGIWEMAGADPSSQTVGSLSRTRLPAKPAIKSWQKSDFGEFACREKYIQLLLNERIWRGQTFDKPPYYQKNQLKM